MSKSTKVIIIGSIFLLLTLIFPALVEKISAFLNLIMLAAVATVFVAGAVWVVMYIINRIKTSINEAKKNQK
jgi:NhaP-type Na+/H+ or K+/H+ antiporter